MLTLNRYILLDPILLFFISGVTFATVKFHSFEQWHPERVFSPEWWGWLCLVGCMIAGAVSVKFVGLFVVMLVKRRNNEFLVLLLLLVCAVLCNGCCCCCYCCCNDYC